MDFKLPSNHFEAVIQQRSGPLRNQDKEQYCRLLFAAIFSFLELSYNLVIWYLLTF